ncbi:hypothetical protein GCM10011579_036040 [Streptomyces albiflavescens]|uniref:Uncharacterized protein n=1 Tax=Streptomyces albiflavescens TaxID=1623582 RepID=A0A917Y470_9ACTN|nr:hypothetical protein GCM10011579_036040 [Streptomyces albiflavescens]
MNRGPVASRRAFEGRGDRVEGALAHRLGAEGTDRVGGLHEVDLGAPDVGVLRQPVAAEGGRLDLAAPVDAHVLDAGNTSAAAPLRTLETFPACDGS